VETTVLRLHYPITQMVEHLVVVTIVVGLVTPDDRALEHVWVDTTLWCRNLNLSINLKSLKVKTVEDTIACGHTVVVVAAWADRGGVSQSVAIGRARWSERDWDEDILDLLWDWLSGSVDDSDEVVLVVGGDGKVAILGEDGVTNVLATWDVANNLGIGIITTGIKADNHGVAGIGTIVHTLVDEWALWVLISVVGTSSTCGTNAGGYIGTSAISTVLSKNIVDG